MNSKKQYVNIVKNINQIKVDNQILDENFNIESNEQSSFLQVDEYLPEDAIFKIASLDQNIDQTYLTTLLYNDTQKILQNDDPEIQTHSCARLNDTQSIICDKNLLFETEHFFQRTGIDYIFSPFSILYLHAIQTSTSNRMNILVLENKIYFMILNTDNNVVYSNIKNMTSFEDIQSSDFYEDEIDRQKLFDEINFLETQKYITEAIEGYYELHENFLSDIDLLYTYKQLSKEQIIDLENHFDMQIHYRQVSIDESLNELAQQQSNQSFTNKRIKEKKSSSSNMTIFAVLTGAIAIALIYFFSLQGPTKQTQKPIIKKEKEISKDLPNHIDINKKIVQHIKQLFAVIPYSAVLHEITINKNNSTLQGTLLSKDIFIKELQPQLLNLYTDSTIEYEDDTKDNLLFFTIKNDLLKKEPLIHNSIIPEYIIDEFIPYQRIIEQLKSMMPKNTIISYKTKTQTDITTYNFMVSAVFKTPTQFYEVIAQLNKELYSINIDYPLNMRKTPEGIETNFILQFHQY